MNTKNKIWAALFASAYLLALYLLFLPAIKGLHSSRTLQYEITLLDARVKALKKEEHTYALMNSEWENQLVFSEAALLEFMLQLTDEFSIRLVDFNVEQAPDIQENASESMERFHFEIRGKFSATLSFLNAIEQRFPFATLEEINIEKKREKRKNFLETRFYIQQ